MPTTPQNNTTGSSKRLVAMNQLLRHAGGTPRLHKTPSKLSPRCCSSTSNTADCTRVDSLYVRTFCKNRIVSSTSVTSNSVGLALMEGDASSPMATTLVPLSRSPYYYSYPRKLIALLCITDQVLHQVPSRALFPSPPSLPIRDAYCSYLELQIYKILKYDSATAVFLLGQTPHTDTHRAPHTP